jgi:WhiB family transcriptional regulator, redox-sensing transcriptional regulator
VSYEWMEQALCAQSDPDLWFPEKGGTSAEARRICEGCPVLMECIAHTERVEATVGPQEGAWAGRNRRSRRAASAAKCGREDRDRSIRRLTDEGLTASEIALKLGCNPRTVTRVRTS